MGGTSDAALARRQYGVSQLIAVGLILLVTMAAAGAPLLVPGANFDLLAAHLFRRQDLPLVVVVIAAVLLSPVPTGTSGGSPRQQSSVLILALTVLALLLVGVAGNYLLFRGIQLTRDEQMAVFDQQIFARGAALWPIPIEWRSFADALGRRFMLPIGANEYWVSQYLPVHAGFRALISLIADPALTSPLFTALGAVCTWLIARRLWPASRDVAVVGLILLVTSSQVVIMSMTSFSMSMHMGLNLLWLLLFLRNRWPSHVLAVVVGFVATGIHQPLYHPLFALPFCVLLLTSRQWSIAAFYAVAYALIAVAWMSYPPWIVSHGIAPAIPIDCANSNCAPRVDFVERFLAAVGLGVSNIWLTACNVLRFFVWQHPLLLPLGLFGAISCWRADPLVKALAASFLLPIIVKAAMLPWQGQGWGYRYVQPALGCAILLACYGFNRIQQSGLSLKRPLAITTAIAVALLVVHGWMATQIVRPFAEIRGELAAIPADIVIVDTDEVPFGQDVVFNRSDLSNRPKLLIASLVKPSEMPKLCSMGTIAFFDGPKMAPLAKLFGTPVSARASPEAQLLHFKAEAANCRTIP